MRVLRIRTAALPLLVLPGYVIVSSLQACTSDTDPAAAPASGSSAVGPCTEREVAKVIAGRPMCCSDEGRELACHLPSSVVLGARCEQAGATAQGEAIRLALDVCVIEACSGDRTCDEFATLAESRVGPVVCEGGVWKFGAAPRVHRVERACLTVGTITCASGTVAPTAYARYPTTTGASGSTSGYSCGYGSGYGAATSVPRHALVLLRSTCEVGGAGGAPAECPPDDL